MHSNTLTRLAAAIALTIGAVASAHALNLSHSGNLTLNNDVAEFTFTVASGASDIRIWTDSYDSGVNFDPFLTLWQRSGADFALIGGVDDDDTIGAGQTFFDAGLFYAALSEGEYLVSVTAAPYIAVGSLRSAGYAFDPAFGPIDETPIAQWNQPSYDINTNNQKGTFWSVNVTAVPEPSTYALLALGLGVVAWSARRSQAR